MTHLKTFFEGTFPPAEGFEVANQGVTRRAPGEGPDSTADAQEVVATDRNPEHGPVTITWNPGEYGADTDKILGSMHGFETLREKLKDAGAYDSITLDFHEAQELKSCLEGFLNSRTYSKPTVQFASEILKQIEPGVVAEDFTLWRPSEGPSPVPLEPRPEPEVSQRESPFDAGPTKQAREMYPYLHADVTPQMYDRYAQENGRPARSENEVRWWMASRGYGMNEEANLEKSSEKERGEHPWMTRAQSYQVAKDHASEKMESVFRKKQS